jgi:hypothetical protein
MGLLTLEEINQTLNEVGLKDHDRLYYFLAALFIGQEEDVTGQERAEFIRGLTPEERASKAAEIHKRLTQDSTCSYKASLQNPGPEVEHAWSDKLPGSTAREYTQLMEKVNDRALLSGEAQNFFYNVVNGIVRTNPDNQDLYSYAGLKGGSTAWVFTEAAFFTKRTDEIETEYTVLLNGSQMAQDDLSNSFNDFRVGVLFEPSFRKALAREFKTYQ